MIEEILTILTEGEDQNVVKPSDTILERLAALEHEQWIHWARNLIAKENLSKERIDRWEKECFMPYEELSEEMKEFDREWARKAMEIVLD